jgi:hypothetical protein
LLQRRILIDALLTLSVVVVRTGNKVVILTRGGLHRILSKQ